MNEGKSRMRQQELLPFDKQEFFERCQAIERLSPEATNLTAGQLKKVQAFLRSVFKHKWSSPNGTITFVRCPNPVPGSHNLAIEFYCSTRTIDNWLRWSIEAGLIATVVNADRYGRRQTTLEFRWENIFALSEISKEDEIEATNAKRFPDQRETVSRPTRNGFQTNAKRFPDQRETVSLSSITYSEPTKEPPLPEAAADLGRSVEEILSDRLFPTLARRLATLCDAQTARDVIAEFDYSFARGILKSPGAIAARIETGRWPQEGVKTAAEIRAAVESSERRRALEQARAAARNDNREQAAATVAELEARVGPILDSMPAADLERFAKETLGDLLFARWKSGRLAADCRLLLLTALDGAVVLT